MGQIKRENIKYGLTFTKNQKIVLKTLLKEQLIEQFTLNRYVVFWMFISFFMVK